MKRSIAFVVACLTITTGCSIGEDGSKSASRADATPTDLVRPFASPATAALGEPTTASCPAGEKPDLSSLTWEKRADLKIPRTEVAAAALDGKVYVAGGFTADGKASRAVEIYDPETDTWGRSLDLPSGRHHAGLATARGRLWIVGGYDERGHSLASVFSWAPDEDSWRPEPRLPTARGALAVATVYDGIHAVGGATGFGGRPRLSDEHAYLAPGGDRWTLLDPLPEPRDHLAAVGMSGGATLCNGECRSHPSGQVYVVGGRHLSLATNEARVDGFLAFDTEAAPATWNWTTPFTMPRSRGGLAAVSVLGHLFVFGGEEPGGTIGPVDYFEIGDYAWCGAPPLPTPRHGLGAAVIGNRVYVVGGGPTPGLSVSGANETLTVEE